MRHVFHYLLHLVESAAAAGPHANVSQLSMKRYTGTLSPCVRQTRHAAENVVRKVLLPERIKLLNLKTHYHIRCYETLKKAEQVTAITRMQNHPTAYPKYECHSLLASARPGQLISSENRLLKMYCAKIKTKPLMISQDADF